MKFGCSIGIFLNSAHLICRSTDISKYFRGSLRLRDNESRLYIKSGNPDLRCLSSSTCINVGHPKSGKPQTRSDVLEIPIPSECELMYYRWEFITDTMILFCFLPVHIYFGRARHITFYVAQIAIRAQLSKAPLA